MITKSREKQIINSLKQAQRSMSKTTVKPAPTTIILMIFLAVALLISISLSGEVLTRTTMLSEMTQQQRAGISLIANTIKSADATGAIAQGTGPEGSSIVLLEETEDNIPVETRIYLYNGYIVEEYVVSGTDYEPEQATKLFKSNVFAFSYENGLLSVTTDQGTAQIALTSNQEVR